MLNLVNSAFAAVIDTSLPGPYSTSTGLGPIAIIGNLYYFALGIGGLLAFGSIVYAGIKWATSQGNPSSISDAKDQITQAALGLLLLLGSYIILNTINPALTVLKIPKLESVQEATEGGGTGGGAAETCGTPPSSPGTCNGGRSCQKDSVSGNYSCINDSYVYCGRKLSDGSISKKCFSASDTCIGSGPAGDPSYVCVPPAGTKSDYYCEKSGTMVANTCSRQATGGQELLSACTTRCGNIGATCVESQEICNPQ